MGQFYTEEETVQAIKKLLSKKMLIFAKATLREGLATFPSSKHLQYLQAHIATELHDFNTSAHLFVDLLEDEPDNPEFLMQAAQAFNRMGDPERALGFANHFLEINKNNPDGLYAIADIHERNNSVEHVEEIVSQLPEKTLDLPKWKLMQTRVLLARKKYSDAVDFIESLCISDDSDREVDYKIGILFYLSKAYDRLGEFDKAWEAAKQAHELDVHLFNPETFFSQFDEMHKFMTKEILNALIEGPKTELEPLFIVGNPRSGTSLLEQILSMHPDVENGGEMSASGLMQMDVPALTDSFHPWPYNLLDLRETEAAKLSKQYCSETECFRNGKKIVSNKSLNLHVQMGFLSKILPSSRAILLHRHPLDNLVSCYTTNLISSGHTYTNSLESLGRTWVERKKIADLWLELLSIPVMELHYEELVTNQRKETERVIEFLDLPWHEECMEFHTSTHVARTISYDQVNRKMYTSSTGRWKNYEKHLSPLIDCVSDYI